MYRATAAAFLVALVPALTWAAGITWRPFVSPHSVPLFYQASGIAVGAAGNVFVADQGDHRVEKFTAAGQLIDAWGVDAPQAQRFDGPWGVAVDRLGHVYLADRGIVKLSSSGRFLARWQSPVLSGLSGVGVSTEGTVFALSLHAVPHSPTHDRITISRWSQSGQRLGQTVFSYPEPAGDAVLNAAIAAAPDGGMIVSVAGQRFCHSCDGTYYQLWTISPSGVLRSRVQAPAGGMSVTVNSLGTIYVAAPHRIYTIDPTFHQTMVWGSSGCGPEAFGNNLRLGLWIGGGDNLSIADSQPVAVRPGGVVAPLRNGVLHLRPSTGGPATLFGVCPPANHTARFQTVTSLAVGPRGVDAADEGAGLILRFTPSGRLWSTVATDHSPFVADDGQGTLYAADLPRDLLVRIGSNGTVTGHLASLSAEDVAFGRSGLIDALTPDGRVLVVRPNWAAGQARVVRQWRLHGYTANQGGVNPVAIALDSAGNVYVADTRFNRVQTFSATGRPLAIWGGWGSAPGRFERPNGIGVTSSGRIYVLDSGNNRVQVFLAGGKLLGTLARGGMAPGQVLRPGGLAVDGHGNVYMGDNGNDRIQMLAVLP